MKIELKSILALTLFCLMISAGHRIEAGDYPFSSCDNDGDPWNERFCVLVKGGVHTTITLNWKEAANCQEEGDSTASYILFDNILDRDGILVFVGQPYFWQDMKTHDIAGALDDSTAIWLPFPDIPSGIFEIKMECGQEKYYKKFLMMK
jgi:hypothetical protein